MSHELGRPLRGLAKALILSSGLAASGAFAQPVALYTIQLTTGETLQNVAIVSETDEFITIAHPVLGNVTLARSGIASTAHTGNAPEVPAPETPAPPPAPVPEDAPPPVEPEEEKGPWSGYADLGLAGTAGNTETLTMRAAAGVKRETEETIFRADARYRLNTDSGNTTANQAIGSVRHDWLLPGSPWGLFVEALLEYDEFKDFDFRLDLLGGLTYEFIANDTTRLVGQAGVGAYNEFGAPDEEWTPQGLVGLRLEHAFNDRTKWIAYGNYYPSFFDIADYRIIAGTNIEVALNEDKSLFLKAGVEDRYSSEGGGDSPHDVDFYVTLGVAW